MGLHVERLRDSKGRSKAVFFSDLESLDFQNLLSLAPWKGQSIGVVRLLRDDHTVSR